MRTKGSLLGVTGIVRTARPSLMIHTFAGVEPTSKTRSFGSKLWIVPNSSNPAGSVVSNIRTERTGWRTWKTDNGPSCDGMIRTERESRFESLYLSERENRTFVTGLRDVCHTRHAILWRVPIEAFKRSLSGMHSSLRVSVNRLRFLKSLKSRVTVSRLVPIISAISP